MTNIEQKALELVNEEIDRDPTGNGSPEYKALCRAIERHEAFRQEVSDVVEAVLYSTYMPAPSEHKLRRFIITKPDPLVECMKEAVVDEGWDMNLFRAALAKRGLEIREKSGD